MDIERGWASTIFQMVDAEPDLGNKKVLLREIAATEGINSEQRKRAAAQLQSLEAPSVEVNQLPVEEPPPAPPPVAASAPARKAPTTKKPTAKEPPAPPPPAPSPAPSPPPSEDGLIRKLPF
jgi:hypothetical protein